MPLSASTVTGCNEEIAEDIDIQLMQRINTSLRHALQVDESTDIANKTILLDYARYLYQEDFLCALLLPTNTMKQKCSSQWMARYQDNLNGPFVLAYAQTMTGQLSG